MLLVQIPVKVVLQVHIRETLVIEVQREKLVELVDHGEERVEGQILLNSVSMLLSF